MLTFYIFIVACFFSGVLYYLINYVLLPYNSDKVLDIKNLVIVSVVGILTITSIFSFFHMILDKLFFCKFYEKPRLFLAIRRGFFLGLLFAGLAWVRIFGYWDIQVVSLVLALVVLFEAMFLSIGVRKRTVEEAKKGYEKEEEEEEEELPSPS